MKIPSFYFLKQINMILVLKNWYSGEVGLYFFTVSYIMLIMFNVQFFFLLVFFLPALIALFFAPVGASYKMVISKHAIIFLYHRVFFTCSDFTVFASCRCKYVSTFLLNKSHISKYGIYCFILK